MNLDAYDAVRNKPDGVGLTVPNVGLIAVTGRDRAKYLQGQISNDVLALQDGQLVHACLLNNTGHLLSDLIVYCLPDLFLIACPRATAETTLATLSRYVIRERVEMTAVDDEYAVRHIEGAGAPRLAEEITTGTGGTAHVFPRNYYGGRCGQDIILMGASRDEISRMNELLGGVYVDADTDNVLRTESGQPRWGAELDEKIIPLEAGMSDAISYTKGCYMGQEIIARIHARGHTNRTLRGIRFESLPDAADLTVGHGGERAVVGRVTSSALSPLYGPIALGYVRNEHAEHGSKLTCGAAEGIVADSPFTL